MENSRPHILSARRKGKAKDDALPRLSCELCRQRKLKCDKQEPCSNCASSGSVCVPVRRMRRSRGRHVHRDSPSGAPAGDASTGTSDDTLAGRLSRLESLLMSMDPSSEAMDAVPTQVFSQTPASVDSARAGQGRQSLDGVPSDKPQRSFMERFGYFWADLVDEIQDLRDVVEAGPVRADQDIAQEPDPAQINAVDGGIRVLGLGEAAQPDIVTADVPSWDSDDTTHCLCQMYLDNVDPIIKILHRPSLSGWLLRGEQYMGYPDGHPSTTALRSAVFYAAACSMTESHSPERFTDIKSNVVSHYRRKCEAAIERSGLLATRDITVLQAFVLYLVARKTQDRSRAIWTLVAIAVRIAEILCLNVEPDEDDSRRETFFEQQMRRRLWLTICLMDLQASTFGLALDPLISYEKALSYFPLPGNLNDSDFNITTTTPVSESEGLTDTTFALVTYRLQRTGRLLNFKGQQTPGASSPYSTSSDPVSRLEERRQIASQFEREVLELLHFCDPESSPLAWFTWHGTHNFVAAVRLAVLRPLQQPRGSGNLAPRHTPGDAELLLLAVRMLEHGQLTQTDPRAEGFRWYPTVPWPVLAIAITECYVCADEALVRRAWPTIEAAYGRHEAVVAKHSGGELRGSLGKLMRRVRAKVVPRLEGKVTGQTEALNGLISKPGSDPMATQSTSEMPSEKAILRLRSLATSDQPMSDLLTSDAAPPLDENMVDDPWDWGEIASGFTFQDFASPGTFFYSETDFGK